MKTILVVAILLVLAILLIGLIIELKDAPEIEDSNMDM